MSQPADVLVQSPNVGSTEAQPTAEPLKLSLPATAAPTPDADATPEPTAAPTITEPEFEFLPIYTKADTKDRAIAITLDDCSHLDNLRMAAVASEQTGAKLTLFPLGQAVMKDGMQDVLKICVEHLGYEIENRTWSNAPLYQVDDGKLASEIWSADIAVDYVFDADYDMHFFRMRGGSGTRDTRTHAYLKQLGYDAIVTWTEAAGESTIEELCDSLAPGNIYLFSTTTEDIEKLTAFLTYAQQRGYRCVTLNELLGYEPNTITPSEVPVLSQTLPALENYEPLYMTQKLGDRTWQVYLIQSRLVELGYLTPVDVDGMFGYGTSAALSEFQAASNLLGSGVASAETQTYLFSENARPNPGDSLFS